MKDYKQQIESLRDCEPGTAIRLTRRVIAKLGGSFEGVQRNLALAFSHSWRVDPVTDNIIIERLPDIKQAYLVDHTQEDVQGE